MNWRALGCGGFAAVIFILLGVIGIWRVLGPTACPDGFEVPSGRYEAAGEPADEPRLPDSADPLVAAGEIGIGFARWPLWVEADAVPGARAEELPARLAFGCPDGTFQVYEAVGS